MENKPREFWIRFRIDDNASTHQITDVSMNPLGYGKDYKNDFHVIEFSAFEKLQLENTVLKEKLEIAESQIEDLKSQIGRLNG